MFVIWPFLCFLLLVNEVTAFFKCIQHKSFYITTNCLQNISLYKLLAISFRFCSAQNGNIKISTFTNMKVQTLWFAPLKAHAVVDRDVMDAHRSKDGSLIQLFIQLV